MNSQTHPAKQHRSASLRRAISVCLLLLWLVVMPGSLLRGSAHAPAQSQSALQKAIQMLALLTPEEKVGQLFLVTFSGSQYQTPSQIDDLIKRYHVGGVVLLRSNDNFTSGAGAASSIYELNRALQTTKWDAAQGTVTNLNGVSFSPQYIPLLIGVSQEGSATSGDQILEGLTVLPSPMAIGATWNPNLAQQAGAVLGKELAALGFNLYLGPSLDVLVEPHPEMAQDMGARVFGGSPYWVGKMGQSYIAGLHQGSENRLLVIGRNFPGRGSSDREPDEEVATVRKSYEQLLAVDLAPFLAAVQGSTPQAVLDGLLVSHIRYEGFQGSIRSTTRPVSSDSAALDLLFNLPGLQTWRQQGGLLVSDNLGSQAIRTFYDPTGLAFDARTAAREAFFAGNDLLFLDQLIASNDPDSFTTTVRTLDFFAQKYREDEAFAQRVDASVTRILTQKYELYPEFTQNRVIPDEQGLGEVGNNPAVTTDIARRAVTLIYPSLEELTSILPSPPAPRERIVFLTDVQSAQQCSTCAETTLLPVDGLQNAVLRLYGPRAGGLVSQSMLLSYSFADLEQFLNGTVEYEQMLEDLQLADWVVVSMLRPHSDQSATQAFQRLLSERPDLLRGKKVIAFAFDAPYFLDATDISKLTAYYVLYSPSPTFVEVAARVLFNEQVAVGSLPVSVPGSGYLLSDATAPDPQQVIPLDFEFPIPSVLSTTATPEPSPAPIYEIGDVIQLRTGTILDRNGNPVPDGTQVRFHFTVISQNSPTQQQIDTPTVDGIARAIHRLERSGVLEIYAATTSGVRSNLLRLDTVSGGVTVVPPTPMPTETPTMTPTPTVTVAPTITPTQIPTPTVGLSDWLLTLFTIGSVGLVAAWVGLRLAVARWGLRWALCGLIGGLLAYNYVALGLPGSDSLVRQSGTMGVITISVLGVIFGLAVGFTWRRMEGARLRPERPSTGPRSQSD